MNKASRRNGAFAGAVLGDVMLWGGAALAVVSVHAGAVLWAMREPPAMASDGPPPAIMIELAALPEATNTEETELTEDWQDAAASQAVQELKASEPEPVEQETVEKALPDEPEPIDESEQVEEVQEPQPEEIEQEAEVAVPSALRPRLRPERPAPRKPKAKTPPKQKKAVPRPQKSARASQSAVKAQNRQAQKSSRNAAAQSARGAGRSMSPAKWQSRLLAHLERRKPRSKGERGMAYVTFRINTAGQVLSARLARSSGSPAVDQAALSLVRRSSPVPPPPPGVQHTITVPVKFSRR